jgi:hypothetical protein
MDPLIFISYRRTDRHIVRALQGAIESVLPRRLIVRDLEAFPAGEDLSRVIADDIQRSDVILAVIGDRWIPDQRYERSSSKDWVRFEISLALAWNRMLVPVLVEDTPMPRPEMLTSDIAALAERVGVPLRDSDWTHDIARILDRIAPGVRRQAHDQLDVTGAGPVAGGDIIMRGDMIAGRDLSYGDEQLDR